MPYSIRRSSSSLWEFLQSCFALLLWLNKLFIYQELEKIFSGVLDPPPLSTPLFEGYITLHANLLIQNIQAFQYYLTLSINHPLPNSTQCVNIYIQSLY